MKLRRINGTHEIELTRSEMLEIARRHNEAFYFNPDEFYDTDEILSVFPDSMIITEHQIGVTDEGFWIYEEDFWNQFRVHAEESDDCTDDYEIEYFFYDYKNHKRI
jgi:hypothetical protein